MLERGRVYASVCERLKNEEREGQWESEGRVRRTWEEGEGRREEGRGGESESESERKRKWEARREKEKERELRERVGEMIALVVNTK